MIKKSNLELNYLDKLGWKMIYLSSIQGDTKRVSDDYIFFHTFDFFYILNENKSIV